MAGRPHFRREHVRTHTDTSIRDDAQLLCALPRPELRAAEVSGPAEHSCAELMSQLERELDGEAPITGIVPEQLGGTRDSL